MLSSVSMLCNVTLADSVLFKVVTALWLFILLKLRWWNGMLCGRILFSQWQLGSCNCTLLTTLALNEVVTL